MKMRLLSLAMFSATLAACASQPSANYSAQPPAYDQPLRCLDCGRVERIETVYGAKQNTRTGAVLGGIVGGVVGNQFGKGDGKTAATVAGVVGGAVAGNAIENKRNEQTFNIIVRMDDGRQLVINQNTVSPDLHSGSLVRVSNGRITPLY